MLQVAFHLAMLVVDGLALRHVRRHAGVRGLAVALGGAAGAAWLLAWGAMLTQPADPHFGPRFAFLGCLAAGLFLHGPLLLVLSAILVSRRERRAALALGAAAVLVAGVGRLLQSSYPRAEVKKQLQGHRTTPADLHVSV